MISVAKIAPNFTFKLPKARLSVANEQLKCPPKPPKLDFLPFLKKKQNPLFFKLYYIPKALKNELK